MNNDFLKKWQEHNESTKIKIKTPKEEQLIYNTKKQYSRRYIVSSYMLDNNSKFSMAIYPEGGRAVDYKRKYFIKLDAAKHSAFLERLKNRQADIFDLEEGNFL